jgi:hypothetical protein
MDHETALEAANEALSGRAIRSSSRIASVELRGVDPMLRSGPALPSFDDRPLSREVWHVAAMVAVGVLTLVFVIALWLL